MGGTINNANMPENMDMWVVLAENAQGEKPTEAYCKQYAASHNVDPERMLLDYSDAGVTIPIQDPPNQFSLTQNAMATTYQNIDPYYKVTYICAQTGAPCATDADCSGGDFCGIISSFSPWHAVLDGSNFKYIWSSFYDEAQSAQTYINQLTQ